MINETEKRRLTTKNMQRREKKATSNCDEERELRDPLESRAKVADI